MSLNASKPTRHFSFVNRLLAKTSFCKIEIREAAFGLLVHAAITGHWAN
jgi:hypothetical protein